MVDTSKSLLGETSVEFHRDGKPLVLPGRKTDRQAASPGLVWGP